MIYSRFLFVLLLLNLALLQSCGNKKDYLITIKTRYGNIKLVLYDQTPKHKDNFIKLAKTGFYDSLLFHRVIDDFMIQTGDPNTKKQSDPKFFGKGGPGYTIPPEFHPDLIHEKGVIAAARQGDNINPGKESNGSQFYIVEGMVYSDKSLRDSRINFNELYKYFGNLVQRSGYQDLNEKVLQLQTENRVDELQTLILSYKDVIEDDYDIELDQPLSQKQIEAYTTIGGIPHLDGAYTVFGKVVDGLDVVEKIAAVPTDLADKPVQDVMMTIDVEEWNRQKIEKEFDFSYPAK
jgi:peptidyl-prolyl cis-trans isomerase B (cyclophilin B)